MNSKWDRNRIYSVNEVINMAMNMARGSWKGRIGSWAISAFKRVAIGEGEARDFEMLEEFGLSPENSPKPWENESTDDGNVY